MRLRLAVAVFCVWAWCPSGAAQAPPEVRALWVVRTSMTSARSIAAMVSAARAGGFNTLFVQVRGRGDAYYASRVEPRAAALANAPADFDPLAVTLREAKAAGLAVHAWVNVGLVVDAPDVHWSDRHMVRRHPEWLMLPRDLVPALGRMRPKDPRYVSRLAAWTRSQSASVEGLFASPLHADAVDHLARVIDDLVSHYELDGVHLDYIRFPGAQFDFGRAALDAFAREVAGPLPGRQQRDLRRAAHTNPLVYVDRFPAAWETFRRKGLTALVRRLRTVVYERRPGAIVSAAAVADLAAARGPHAQDWPGWLAQDLVDAVCPMIYTTDAVVFREQAAAGRAAAGNRPYWVGIGAYRLSSEQTVQHVEFARRAGANGVVLFSYDALIASEQGADALVRIGQAAFGR